MSDIVLLAPTKSIADIFDACAPRGLTATWRSSAVSADEKKAILADAEVVVLHPAELPVAVIESARRLRLIQLLTAGYDKIDIAKVPSHIAVATNGGANAVAVAEHAVALLLALYKRIPICDRTVREGGWRKNADGFNTFEVAGKTVGIVGAGNIGRKVAARFKAFETEILYFDPAASPEIETAVGARRVTLEELLALSDIVALHLPLTASTHGLLGERQLAMMKPNATILNLSRGEIIDETALVAVLRSGKLLGAGLDVYGREPVRTDNPLLSLPNVVLTPHTAGHAYEGWYRRSRFAWANIERLRAGGALLSTVKA